jgi:Flp pilus assembly protein TadG
MKRYTKKYCLLKQGWKAESGQALVEAALALPLLALILLGGISLGQAAYASIEVENAAKAGVQYGTQSGVTAPDTTGIQNAASAAAPNLTLVTTATDGCVCSDGTASTCLLTDCASSHIEQSVTVATEATITPIVRLPGLPTTYTLKGQAVQQCLH